MSERTFLFAHWEGGGNTPPMLAIVRRLIARGHHVRVMSDPYDRPQVEAAGAAFRRIRRAVEAVLESGPAGRKARFRDDAGAGPSAM